MEAKVKNGKPHNIQMLIKCPHCGCPYDPYDGYELANSQVIDVADDDVFITTDYQCPHCRGVTRGVQKGIVEYWESEEFEAV